MSFGAPETQSLSNRHRAQDIPEIDLLEVLAWTFLLSGSAYFFMRRRQLGFLKDRAGLKNHAFNTGVEQFDKRKHGATDMTQIFTQHFISLQHMFNLSDHAGLQEVVTPVMFAELLPWLGKNKTRVLSLKSEIVDVTSEFGQAQLSVLYTGDVQDEGCNETEPLSEIWNFVRESETSAWLLNKIETAN